MKKIDPLARYHETNEWARQEGDLITIGITDFAQTMFGEIINIELPSMGSFVQKNKKLALLESSKVTTEIESPLSGKIIEINSELKNHPEWLNESPFQKGWLIKIKSTHIEEWNNLLTAAQYKNYISVFFNKN